MLNAKNRIIKAARFEILRVRIKSLLPTEVADYILESVGRDF